MRYPWKTTLLVRLGMSTERVILPIDGQPTWFRHRDSGQLHRRFANRDRYYPVNEMSVPIPPADLGYAEEPAESLITIPCDVSALNQPVRHTRRYVRANEEVEELLNHPQGIERV